MQFMIQQLVRGQSHAASNEEAGVGGKVYKGQLRVRPFLHCNYRLALVVFSLY